MTPPAACALRTGARAAGNLVAPRLVDDVEHGPGVTRSKGIFSACAKLRRLTVIARDPGWQVMARVSLGEFLSSEDQDAYGCINSKRVDFALMGPGCRVHHALQDQATGHHLPGGAATARDAVKKEELRKAGMGYHEVVAGHTTAGELRALVEKLVPA